MKTLAVKVKIPRQTGHILDVGSGNNSLDIATHLMDLMPDDNKERGGGLELSQRKIFKQGNIEAMPFENGYFDFTHAAHVLEHVDSPAQAIKELLRTSAAGYIETPSAVIEQCAFLDSKTPGWSFHRWYVWAFPDYQKIYFKPKTDGNANQYCGCKYGKKVSELAGMVNFAELDAYIPYFARMTQFPWKNEIKFEVWSDSQTGVADSKYGCNCAYSAFFANLSKYFKSWRYLEKRIRLKKKFPEVYKVIKSTLG